MWRTERGLKTEERRKCEEEKVMGGRERKGRKRKRWEEDKEMGVGRNGRNVKTALCGILAFQR